MKLSYVQLEKVAICFMHARNNMKLLLLSFDWRSMARNDPQELLRRLARDGFLSSDIQVTVFALGKENYEQKINDTVSVVTKKAPRGFIRFFIDVLYGFYALAYYKSQKIKFDYIASADPHIVWWLWFIPKRPQVLFFLNTHYRILAKANRKIISYCYIIVTEFLTRRLFSKVFVISSEGYNYAQDYLRKGDTDCILYTPNTFIYNYEQEQRESVIVREQMVKNNEQIILVVSRLEKEKGVDRALQLFSRSIAQGLNARLLIIGNGSQQATLWRYIKDNNFEDKIIHIPFVQHDSLWRYYLASDVLLLCSRSEGLGLVVLEAMYARLPVASTKVGGLCDSIGEHEERGIYIDEFAVEKFSRYLQKISTNDQEIIEQKEKAYQFVEEKIKQFTTISKLLHNEHTTFNS